MTALHAAASSVFLDTPEARELATVGLDHLLAGDKPRLLDEWQVIPDIWNAVRRDVDRNATDGRFILTGSSKPADDSTRHTGAGRFLRLQQRTMTWSERGISTGTVSLTDLFAGHSVETDTHKPDFDEVLNNLCVSGFPRHIRRDATATADIMRAYATEISHTDVYELERLRHDPEVIHRLLAAMSRAVASKTTLRTLTSDVRTIAPAIQPETIAQYLHILQRLFVVESIPAWTGQLRSRATLRRSPKYNVADPALAAAILEATPTSLRDDIATAGVLFESAVLHDLVAYAEALGGSLHHFRDSVGHEIDAIITLPDGRWAGIEIKLGGGAAAQAAEKLSSLITLIDAPHPAAFAAVITGTGFHATYPNGVHTFPLSALAL